MGSNGGAHRFIDKRNAVTYTLVASATGDSGDGSGRVFLRTDHNDHLPSPLTDDEQPEVHPADPSSALPPSRRQELRELGLPDDGYDYLQHIKSCSSQPQPGVTQLDSPLPVSASLPPDSKAYDARSALTSAEASALPPQPDSTVASSSDARTMVAELDQLMLEKQNDTADAALEGSGDLQDDIVLQVAAGTSNENDKSALEWLYGDSSTTVHVDAAKREGEGAPKSLDDALGSRAYERRDGLLGVLDAQFEKLALEYDEENIGELDEEEVEASGPPEHSLMGCAYEDFEERMQHKPDLQSLAPEGYNVLDPEEDRSRVKQALMGDEVLEESKQRTKELAEHFDERDPGVAADDEAREAIDQAAPPQEREEWDVESWSVASSSTTNAPAILGTQAGKRRSRKTHHAADQSGSQNRHDEEAAPRQYDALEHIELNADGMPKQYMPQKVLQLSQAEDSSSTRNRTDAMQKQRGRNESREEKRERKQRVKEERRAARAAKKETRVTFKTASVEADKARSKATVRPSTPVVSLSE